MKDKGKAKGDWEVIHSYTRKQALQDGVLVDVSEMAKEAGFTVPVAVTAAVWELINRIPESMQGIQDVNGRLWDVLFMLAYKIKSSRGESTILYDLLMDRIETREIPDEVTGNYHRKKVLVRALKLKAVCGPGDEGPPVLTIMLPDED